MKVIPKQDCQFEHQIKLKTPLEKNLQRDIQTAQFAKTKLHPTFHQIGITAQMTLPDQCIINQQCQYVQ